MIDLDKHLNIHSDRLDGSRLPKYMQVNTKRGVARSPTVAIFNDATSQAISLTSAPVAILATISAGGCQIASMAGLELFNSVNLNQELAGIQYCHDRAICAEHSFVVNDFQAFPQLANSSLCQVYGIQAYLGLSIITTAGARLGTISILDSQARQFSDRDIALLHLISRLVASEFERSLLSQAELDRQVEELWCKDAGEFKQQLLVSASSSSVEHQDDRDEAPNGKTFESLEPIDLQIKEDIQFKLLTHLAQEVRSPLTSILGMARVLQQEIYGSLTSKQKDYLSIIHHSGLQLVKFVDEIAELAAFNRHHDRLTLKSVDLELVCQLTLQTLEPLARQKQQTITLKIGDNSLGGMVRDRRWLLDQDKVRQIIYYLGLSLIQLSGNGQEITIELANLTDRLQIQITTDDRHLLPLSLDPHSKVIPSSADYLLIPSIELSGEQKELSFQTKIGQDLRIQFGLSLSQILAAIHGGTIQITPKAYGYQLTLPTIFTE